MGHEEGYETRPTILSPAEIILKLKKKKIFNNLIIVVLACQNLTSLEMYFVNFIIMTSLLSKFGGLLHASFFL